MAELRIGVSRFPGLRLLIQSPLLLLWIMCLLVEVIENLFICILYAHLMMRTDSFLRTGHSFFFKMETRIKGSYSSCLVHVVEKKGISCSWVSWVLYIKCAG